MERFTKGPTKVKVENGIALLVAKQGMRNTALDVDCWRFRLVPSSKYTREEIIAFFH